MFTPVQGIVTVNGITVLIAYGYPISRSCFIAYLQISSHWSPIPKETGLYGKAVLERKIQNQDWPLSRLSVWSKNTYSNSQGFPFLICNNACMSCVVCDIMCSQESIVALKFCGSVILRSNKFYTFHTTFPFIFSQINLTNQSKPLLKVSDNILYQSFWTTGVLMKLFVETLYTK